jgi:hypothetical protein
VEVLEEVAVHTAQVHLADQVEVLVEVAQVAAVQAEAVLVAAAQVVLLLQARANQEEEDNLNTEFIVTSTF